MLLGIVLSIIAGMAMSVQGVMNTRLGEGIGNMEANAFVQGTAFALAMIVLLFWRQGSFSALGSVSKLYWLGGALGLSYQQLPMFSASVLVFLGTTLTGVGVYDKIVKYAGAGSIVPITGFANSVCAPAMEFRREGLVLGVGAKLFSIAGPVLSYGISASVIYGLIFWLTEVIG